MTFILGMDTAIEVSVGVAKASCDTSAQVAEGIAGASASGNRHVELLMPLVEEALSQIRRQGENPNFQLADLGAVAVGMGPGPFTGLRVGIAAAKMLSHVLQIPLLPVGTLDILALDNLDAVVDYAAQNGAKILTGDGEVNTAANTNAVNQITGVNLMPGSQNISSLVTDFIVAINARRKELYWAHYRLEVFAENITRAALFTGPTAENSVEYLKNTSIFSGKNNIMGYGNRWVQRISGFNVSAPQDLPQLPILGAGAAIYPQITANRTINNAVLRPTAVAQYARCVPHLEPEPLYLRLPDATAPTQRKSTLTRI